MLHGKYETVGLRMFAHNYAQWTYAVLAILDALLLHLLQAS